jgi:hypothetical protein
MYNVDRSASGRTRMLKAKTLAAYHNQNPTKNDYGGEKPSNTLTLLLRSVGQNELCGKCCEPVCDLSNAFIIPFSVEYITQLESDLSSITGQIITIPSPPPGYPEDRELLLAFFPGVCNTETYTANVLNPDRIPIMQHFLGVFTAAFIFPITGFIVIYPLQDWNYSSVPDTIITASNACSESSATATFGCFLEGSPVTMADGSIKAIEDVKVGDNVRGAFGEINTVQGLHRPFLGAGCIANINNEHKTTTHHPHIAADKKFYCVDPNIISRYTYGKEHTIISADGTLQKRKMMGLRSDRICKLEVGIELQTVTGARRVDILDTIKMSPFTQVYHLVVDGSHTYCVDGYAVTGWPREDDFDYDTWVVR